MRSADEKAGIHLGRDAVFFRRIRAMKQEFINMSGMPAEELIASPYVVAFIERWARLNGQIPDNPMDRLDGVEIEGLMLRHMTKRSTLPEVYLAARRGDKVYTAHAIFDFSEIGVVREMKAHGMTFSFNPDLDNEPNEELNG